MESSGLFNTVNKRLKILLGSSHASEDAYSALAGNDRVTVENNADIKLSLRGAGSTNGIIFYPGGRCDPIAYVPFLLELAQEGYLCVIARMPFNLPVLSPDRASVIMSAYPEVNRWVLGGHSLGGAMACRFAARNREKISGLFLLGSYPPDSQDLGQCEFPVTLFYGTDDTFARPEKITALKNVPDHAEFIKIDGGDHYQFGSFRDCIKTASISEAVQQKEVICALRARLGH